MSKQAKYLIDDSKFYIFEVATSWDYDNRANTDAPQAFPGYIYDKGNSCGVRVKRDIQEQTNGKMVLEMFYVTEKSADGVIVSLCSSKGETVFEFSTKFGKFYFNGIKTDIDSILGETRVKVSFDIDKKTAKFAVDGVTGGTFELGSFCDVARMYIGTSGETEIKITPFKNKLYIDYIANETFLGTQTYFPDEWALNGDFKICKHISNRPQMNYTYAKTEVKKGDKSIAVLPVEKTNEDVILEGYFLLPEGADGFNFSFINGDDTVFGIKSENNEFKTLGGEFLRKFTSNVWQVIRFETKDDDITVKIDGKICGTFKVDNMCFDAIEVFFEPDVDASLSFTDIVCEANIDYPDYCPEPKPVRHPEYEVGVNVCNMWREGHHFGWDKITHFKDNLPLIGPYDEGLPEVADWEIKMMVEHGITYQHVCWYCPDSMINAPIKRSRMDQALRDGFMNARYSHMMKFMIMWENASYTNCNPQDFLDYVWPYWCEYFFTDPRYLIINNRPLISIWIFNYVENWGGPEKAKEIIEYINNDIKKYGFDGVYIMNTAIRELSGYKKQSEFCDITYAYHYGIKGYDYDYQKSQIDLLTDFNENHGLAPFMQTVSVGFNACPWHGAYARVPLISLDDHKKALEYIKKHGDDSNGEWYNKIFMMSTWNEYGEGTYIMPSHLHGFGYLDNIREVFAPGSGKCENLLPDENQQKRITYLNKIGRAVIKRHGFEKPDYFKEGNRIHHIWSFENGEKYDCIGAFGNHAEVEYTGSSLIVKPVDDADHYSIHIKVPEGLCDGTFVTTVKVRLRALDNCRIRLAFLTSEQKIWNGDCCLNDDHRLLEKSDEFVELAFVPAALKTWASTITDIRIDNMSKTSFEVDKIELLYYHHVESEPGSISVNGKKLHFDFYPHFNNNREVIVAIDPTYLFFRQTMLYHEYFGEEKKLIIASKDTEAVFVADKETAVVNGKEIILRTPMTLRDGLPVFSLNELCDIFGLELTEENGDFNVLAK